MAETAAHETRTADPADPQGISIDSSHMTVLLTIAGFALFWAALFALLLSRAFAPASDEPMEGFLLRMVMLAGFGSVQLLSFSRIPDAIDTRACRTAIRLISCIILAALAAFSLFYHQANAAGLIAQTALWFMLGAGLGGILVFWDVVWNGIDAERDANSFCSMAISASIVGAALACTVMLIAPQKLCLAAAVGAFVASALIQQLCSARMLLPEPISAATSRQRLNLMDISMLTPAAAAFGLGSSLALNGLRLGVESAFPTALLGIGSGALTMLIIIAVRSSTPSASSVERVVFPVQCACLLLLPFMEDTEAFRIVMAILLADLAAYLISHWNILLLLAYRKRLKAAYHFSQGLTATTLPVALGWATVSVPVVIAHHQTSLYSSSGWGGEVPRSIFGSSTSLALIVCLLAVFVIVLTLSIVPYASNRTVEDLFAKEPPRTEQHADPWRTACMTICEERHLTPREREVFAYLTRGRNADHIANELVISVHTAKTHTARIYRKLGINSQQQLIDMVERLV